MDAIAGTSTKQGLERVSEIMVNFFGSWISRAIAGLAMGGIGVGIFLNRGEPGIVKKFVPWIFACMILTSFSKIIQLLF